jgi:hypothetical protein
MIEGLRGSVGTVERCIACETVCERGDIVPHTLRLSTLCIAGIRENFDRYPSFAHPTPPYFDRNNTANTADQVI